MSKNEKPNPRQDAYISKSEKLNLYQKAYMSKSEKLKLCAWIVLLGFLYSVVYHYIQGVYFGKGYPYSTYLFIPSDKWADFFGLTVMNKGMDPFNNNYMGFGNNYPPFCYLALMPFTQLGYGPGSKIYASLFVLGFLYLMRRATKGSGGWRDDLMPLFIVCTLSYPFQFSIDRLNAENLIVLLVAGFYVCFHEGRSNRIAGSFVGIATGMKIYTGLFALALFSEKRWRSILGYTLIVAGLCTVFAFFALGVTPFEVQAAYARSYPKFMEFTLSHQALQHTSSLFAAFRIVQVLLNPADLNNSQAAAELFGIYQIIAVVLGFVLVTACVIGRLQVWERLTLAVVVILLLPPVSFDYKLMYVFIPLVAFLTADTPRTWASVFCVLFGVLLIPKAWSILFLDVSAGVLINIFVLVLLALILVVRACLPHNKVDIVKRVR